MLQSAQARIARIDPRQNPKLVQELQANVLALQGRGGDTRIAHLTNGELVIPAQMLTPDFMQALAAEARARGIDPRSLFVGSRQNAVNPRTGLMEFGDDDDSDTQQPAPQDDPQPAPQGNPLPPLQSLQGYQPNLDGPVPSPDDFSTPAIRMPFSPSDVDAATRAVYAEARNQSPEGRQAVFNSMLNRMGSPTFPKTLNDVIFQKDRYGNYQYNGVGDPSFNVDPSQLTGPDATAWDQIHGMVQSGIQDAMNGDVPPGPRYYRRVGTTNRWYKDATDSGRLVGVGSIGDHEFFETPDRARPFP